MSANFDTNRVAGNRYHVDSLAYRRISLMESRPGGPTAKRYSPARKGWDINPEQLGAPKARYRNFGLSPKLCQSPVLNTTWTWLLRTNWALCRPFGTHLHKPMLPGTPVPGSRLFRPFGTRSFRLSLGCCDLSLGCCDSAAATLLLRY